MIVRVGHLCTMNTFLFLLFFRHHTNPVGTEWRWKMDDANTVFQGALDSHVGLIKQFKGQCMIHGVNCHLLFKIICFRIQNTKNDSFIHSCLPKSS